ncbi:hypothetical protein ACHAQJ_004401 [Trichoderma viride]
MPPDLDDDDVLLAFPVAPVSTDERIPKIYNWIETHFWPKLTSSQQWEMLPFFRRIKFERGTEHITKHWLSKQARLPNCPPMIKVMIHAIWGVRAKNSSWWDNYHQKFGDLRFPEGPAPGVTFDTNSHLRQRLGNLQRAQAKSSDIKNEDNTTTQKGIKSVPPMLQAIPERPSVCHLSDEAI